MKLFANQLKIQTVQKKTISNSNHNNLNLSLRTNILIKFISGLNRDLLKMVYILNIFYRFFVEIFDSSFKKIQLIQ